MAKSLNPMDAFRREQKKKELKKHKVERQREKKEKLVTMDPEELKDKLKMLERQVQMNPTDGPTRKRKQELEDTLNAVLKKRKEMEAEQKKEQQAAQHAPKTMKELTEANKERIPFITTRRSILSAHHHQDDLKCTACHPPCLKCKRHGHISHHNSDRITQVLLVTCKGEGHLQDFKVEEEWCLHRHRQNFPSGLGNDHHYHQVHFRRELFRYLRGHPSAWCRSFSPASTTTTKFSDCTPTISACTGRD
uniref:Wbp11/ELF5/Saf1 N-terminal domain-containing protein n=1 Tax=Globisporangium ultimum (strain ATCC 200006 / CBS 805.95 / DAOM BR144) TaxID=431595 RepID=K3WF71_GLOUD